VSTNHHLLLVATKLGYQTRAFAAAAQNLGVAFTLATDRCGRMDDPWADNAVPLHFEDPVEAAFHLEQAHEARGPFTGIVALGDSTTLASALFAERHNIPYHPAHAVEAARNKYLAKERFRTAGLLLPEYRRYRLNEHPVPFTLPCVLKPIGLSGSRGVIRANTVQEFDTAYQTVRRLLTHPDIVRLHQEHNQWIQVETYIPGAEFAVEGIVTGGDLHVLALFDKPDPLEGPYFEETIYVTPSSLREEQQAEIIRTVTRGVRALGLSHGPVHAEVRLNEKGGWLLEIAARPIGGYCAKALRFQPDMGLEELIVRHAIGQRIDTLRLLDGATGVMMIPIPKPGIYRGVHGVDQAKTTPGITEVAISAAPGQRYRTYPDESSYLGFIFARAPLPSDVIDALRSAHARLDFDLIPELNATA